MKYNNSFLDSLSFQNKKNLTSYIPPRVDWSAKKLANGFKNKYGIKITPQRITIARNTLREKGKTLTSNEFRYYGRMSIYS